VVGNACLIALVVVIASQEHAFRSSPGGAPRLAACCCWRLIRTTVAFVALLGGHEAIYALAFAFICWAGVIALGLHPRCFVSATIPLEPAFWQSFHFLGGCRLNAD